MNYCEDGKYQCTLAQELWARVCNIRFDYSNDNEYKKRVNEYLKHLELCQKKKS